MGVLDGRVAIVTGGGRGIGAAIAREFAAQGARVVVNDLGTGSDGVGGDEGPAREVAQEINSSGGKALADGGDVADVATGERLVKLAVENFGGLDVVANVAGILRDRMIFNLSEEDWDAVIRVHLKGHYSTIRPASAYWREQKNPSGHYRIINFTSRSGIEGSPGQPNYAAAKMGVVGLTWSLAQGLARYGVTANAIAPGAATRLTGAVSSEATSAQIDQRDRSPENIAPLALYIASEQSDWLTGRVLYAGGYEVSLYQNLETIRQLNSPTPWEYDTLVSLIEKNFKPVANGLPPSLFGHQLEGR